MKYTSVMNRMVGKTVDYIYNLMVDEVNRVSVESYLGWSQWDFADSFLKNKYAFWQM